MGLHDVRAAMVGRRGEAVREGTGFWDGSDAAERAREARAELKER